MRVPLLLVTALALAACGSSREASEASGGSYAITEDGSGDMTIAVTPGASGETLMAALVDAAGRIEWTPPEAAGGLQQVRTESLGPGGTVYAYTLVGARFHVYRFDSTVDDEIETTDKGLAMVQDNGRIDSFERRERVDREVPWEGGEATLTRVLYAETIGGADMDSYLYLLRDGAWWIKVRATFPEGRYAADDLDAVVDALLTEDEE